MLRELFSRIVAAVEAGDFFSALSALGDLAKFIASNPVPLDPRGTMEVPAPVHDPIAFMKSRIHAMEAAGTANDSSEAHTLRSINWPSFFVSIWPIIQQLIQRIIPGSTPVPN